MLPRRTTATITLHRKPAQEYHPNGEPKETLTEEWPRYRLNVYTISQSSREETIDQDGNHVYQRLRVSAPLEEVRPRYQDRATVPGMEEGGPFEVAGEIAVYDNANPFISYPSSFGGVVFYLERRLK